MKKSDASTYQLFTAPKNDFLASVVVFLVALPLCIGIAIASDVPPAAGLITGIVGGLVVGWFSGAPMQVSGPAAGLTVIVYELVSSHGLEVLGIAVLIAGFLQVVAGVLRYGRWFRAVSPAVIRGMLGGIGVLILAGQFHVMVDDKQKENGLENLITIPQAIQKGLPIPELKTKEIRVARRELMIEFGDLHERQEQIHERAGELIPLPQSLKHENPEAVEAEEKRREGLPDKNKLAPVAAKQKELNEDLQQLVDRLDSNGVSEHVRDPSGLKAAAEEALADAKLALENLEQGEAENVRLSQAAAEHGIEGILGQLKSHDWAAKVGIITLVFLIAWETLMPKKVKMIPAPLVAVFAGTLFAVMLQLPVLSVEVPDNLWDAVHFPSLTVLKSVPLEVVLQAGIVIAVVASAETLLCATAVDQLQSHSRTQYNQELTAQGIGNMVCGFLGALPMTGVIVRSSANVEAGARTRLSTILHGTWLLVFVSALAFVLRAIPTAALAAMLVYTGWKLLNIKGIPELLKYGKGELFIYFATLGTIVCTDLLKGVIVGIVLSAAKLLHTFSSLETHLEISDDGRKAQLALDGTATFVKLPVLAAELERVPGNAELHVDFEHLKYIDHACLDLLMNWAKQHESSGGKLVLDWESLHANFDSKALQTRMAAEKTVA